MLRVNVYGVLMKNFSISWGLANGSLDVFVRSYDVMIVIIDRVIISFRCSEFG